VPASIKLKQQYGDDLHVIFVESQGATADAAESFAWRQKWMGVNALWTLEPPVKVDGSTLPKFALLDCEGGMLLSGNPLDQKKKIEEAIADQVKRSKALPAGLSAKLAKAWSSYEKREIGAAIVECKKLAADSALAADANALETRILASTQRELDRGKWCIANGYVDEGVELLTALGKAVKGSSAFDDAIAEQLANVLLPSEALSKEIAAARALKPIETRMKKGKPFEDANVRALQKVADDHAGTKAAARAAHLVVLAKIKPQ
jgi:hypothetical protein